MTPKHLLLTLALVAVLGIAGFFYTSRSSSGGTTSSPKEIPLTSTTETKVAQKTEALKEYNPPADPATPGILKGVVKYDGEPPEPKFKEVPPNTEGCHANVADESLVVDKATKGLKWAIIRITDVTPKEALPKPAKPYQIDQKGCTFTPHVVIVPPGTDLQILNPDKILHNIHTQPYDLINPPQNMAVTGPLTYKAKWLKDAELIEIKCDVHGWMKGFIVCHDPRYCAVTGADGTFEIKNLPPGKYQVNVWQESFGNYFPDKTKKTETFSVEIKAGATTDLGEMKFAPKAK